MHVICSNSVAILRKLDRMLACDIETVLSRPADLHWYRLVDSAVLSLTNPWFIYNFNNAYRSILTLDGSKVRRVYDVARER